MAYPLRIISRKFAHNVLVLISELVILLTDGQTNEYIASSSAELKINASNFHAHESVDSGRM